MADGLRHYRIIGDGIAVLRPESLRGNKSFCERLREMERRVDGATWPRKREDE